MGEVWRAEDPALGRTVAVKVVLSGLSGDPGFTVCFQTEARALAALNGPGIGEIYDYGDADAVAFLVIRGSGSGGSTRGLDRDAPADRGAAAPTYRLLGRVRRHRRVRRCGHRRHRDRPR